MVAGTKSVVSSKRRIEMSYEIKREDWSRFFDSLSRRRFEWKAEIEVLSPSIGDQTLNIALPFNGVTAEGTGEQTTVEISAGKSGSQHQSHSILNPTRVAFLAASEGRGDVVDIEESDGTKTLIRFIEPIDVLVGFTTVEMITTEV